MSFAPVGRREYLFVIEQNIPAYASVFGRDAVLEHFSGSLIPLGERPNTGGDGNMFIAGEEHDEEDAFQTTGQRMKPKTGTHLSSS